MAREVRTVADSFDYLEGPRWHDGRIWVSDFYRHAVYSAHADGSDLKQEADVPNQPSGLGWLPDGRLLIVSMRDARILRREPDGSLVTHADLSGHTNSLLNDMVVDAQGRAFVGQFGFDIMGGADLVPADLYRVDPDGAVSVVAQDMLFANGMTITDDNVLLVGETAGNRITAFGIGPDGSLSSRRVWAEFGRPPTTTAFNEVLGQLVIGADGSCLDAEDRLWVADALGGRVVRVQQGGKIVDEIRPDGGVFACMLGGDEGRTLFMCVAPDFYEHPRQGAREGVLQAVEVDVPRGGRP